MVINPNLLLLTARFELAALNGDTFFMFRMQRGGTYLR